MTLNTKTFLRICLAGSALTALGALAPAQAAPFNPLFTHADSQGAAPAAQPVEFEVYLPLRHKDDLKALLARQQDRSSPSYHQWLTPQQFATRFGPDAQTFARVAHEMAAHGFTVRQDVRSLHVRGTADLVNRAFATQLSLVRGANGQLRPVSIGGLTLSPTLAAAGVHIPAFNAMRTEAHTDSQRIATFGPNVAPSPNVAIANFQVYWFDGLHQAYAYPASNATATAFDGTTKPLNGSGAKIAALMSSDIIDADISDMFNHEFYQKHAGTTLPKVAHVYINGAKPGALTNAFDEASLDTQQESGGAPGASVTLYDIPDLSNGATLAGYTTIDNANAVDIVSSSFGECELVFLPAYENGVDYTYILDLYDELFLQGNAEGITFLASSGDSSGRSCPSVSYFYGTGKANFVPSVESPSDDPNVTAVGGTNLQTALKPDSLSSKYKSENAYSDPEIPYDIYGLGENVDGGSWGAGGGPSAYYLKPDYQNLVHMVGPMRAVPDIGMQVGGCPGGIAKLPCDGGDQAINGNGNRLRSAVYTYLQGGVYGFIGTSVASPELASALAILVELHGRQGNLNPYLYSLGQAQMGGALASPAFHVGIPGYNTVHPNTFPAANFNYTTGLGTPFVAALVGLPTSTPLAGVPQTVTNP